MKSLVSIPAVARSLVLLISCFGTANAQTTDLVAVGGAGWASIPVASSNGNGSFTVTNLGVTSFPGWATTPGARIVPGDFNGDGITDLAAYGAAGWNSVPVAFSNANGSFTVTNINVGSFAAFAATPGVGVVTGDFNGDGKSDLAAYGGAGWASLPVAFSNGNGSFNVTNSSVATFAALATTPGVQIAAGDFNGDGKTDLAAYGAAGWASVAVAFSNGNGTFIVTNINNTTFAAFASTRGVRIVTGDYNGDGRTDLAAYGGAGWAGVPVAFSNGDGSFTVTNDAINSFAAWAATPGVRIARGDYNGDGRTDLAAYGVAGWNSLPVAFSNGDGTFTVTNIGSASFASWAATPGVDIVTGDFNADGRTDLAAFGGPGWASVPVAQSNGNGSFTVTNLGAGSLAGWAATAGVQILTGNFR